MGPMKIETDAYSAEEVLKIIREWSGLTQKDFAKSIHRSEATIRNYEQERRDYTFKALQNIAQIHGLKITIEKKL